MSDLPNNLYVIDFKKRLFVGIFTEVPFWAEVLRERV